MSTCVFDRSILSRSCRDFKCVLTTVLMHANEFVNCATTLHVFVKDYPTEYKDSVLEEIYYA